MNNLELTSLNEQIFHAINGIAGQNHYLDILLVFLSNWFGYLLLGGLIVFLLAHEDKRKGARDLFVVLSAALVAYIATKILKALFPQERPFEALHDINVLYQYEGNDSFPSGHSAFYMSLATSLFFYHRKIASAYFLGALIIGFARIAVGVHWPFDILSGFLLGGVVGASVYYAYLKLYKPR